MYKKKFQIISAANTVAAAVMLAVAGAAVPGAGQMKSVN